MSRRAHERRSDPAASRISHPERVIDPESGVTKGELADILTAVTPRMWPYLDGRIVSVLRCPEGLAHSCFFQRHIRGRPPPGITGFTLAGEDTPASLQEVMALSAPEGIISLVQMGAIEIHASAATVAHPTAGSWLVLDLDPAGLPFAQTVAHARLLADLVEAMDLPVFPKITGGKGIHLVIPFAPPVPFDQLHQLARALATRAAGLWPDIFVANNRKALREQRIFVDYLRNYLGASAIAPFSPRAHPGLPCAVPVSWQELAGLASARAVPVRALVDFVKERADPWADFFSRAQAWPEDWRDRLARAGETVARPRR
ncbi:MAG: hypothetical protein D6740_11040 [Alphaproteobacteria bacterium]|nr:MAG: hypothetical protein D6740_11040 [Alphaproteobacteria bacterium]